MVIAKYYGFHFFRTQYSYLCQGDYVFAFVDLSVSRSGNFLKELLPLHDRGSCLNFANNSRSFDELL